MFSKYNFGVIRTLRRHKGLTLEQLAKNSGLTYPTVASVETNKTLPSMKTLDALAGALHLSASNLLSLAECRMVQMRHADPPDVVAKGDDRVGLDKLKVARFDKGKMIRAHANEGDTFHLMSLHDDCHELCYVLSGRMRLRVLDNEYELAANDTILFDGVLDHSYTALEAGELITVHIPKDVRIIEALLDRTVDPNLPQEDEQV